MDKYKAKMVQAQKDFLEKIGQHVGQCDMLEVTNKRLIASGFGEVEKTPMLGQRNRNQSRERFMISRHANTERRVCIAEVFLEVGRNYNQLLALVSLDWDRELAGFIRDIYEKTGNTVIAVENSGTNNSLVASILPPSW